MTNYHVSPLQPGCPKMNEKASTTITMFGILEGDKST